jgi:xanthine/uracil permease
MTVNYWRTSCLGFAVGAAIGLAVVVLIWVTFPTAFAPEKMPPGMFAIHLAVVIGYLCAALAVERSIERSNYESGWFFRPWGAMWVVLAASSTLWGSDLGTSFAEQSSNNQIFLGSIIGATSSWAITFALRILEYKLGDQTSPDDFHFVFAWLVLAIVGWALVYQDGVFGRLPIAIGISSAIAVWSIRKRHIDETTKAVISNVKE